MHEEKMLERKIPGLIGYTATEDGHIVSYRRGNRRVLSNMKNPSYAYWRVQVSIHPNKGSLYSSG